MQEPGTLPEKLKILTESWDVNLKELEEKIKNCKKCRLSEARNNAVPGEGGFEKKILIVGEAPGYWEDLQGRPFVGRAGKLLEKLLAEIGLSRKDVYITNVVKCRPPNNRTPYEDEIKACLPWLELQIELLKPRIILTLGAVSGKTLFEKFNLEWKGMRQENAKHYLVSTLFGSFHLIAAYHPAAVLRNPKLLPEIRQAFELLRSLL